MFFCEHRRRALRSLALDRDFLRGLDERLVAHLDGGRRRRRGRDRGRVVGQRGVRGPSSSATLPAAEAPQLGGTTRWPRRRLASALLPALRLWFHGVTTASDQRRAGLIGLSRAWDGGAGRAGSGWPPAARRSRGRWPTRRPIHTAVLGAGRRGEDLDRQLLAPGAGWRHATRQCARPRSAALLIAGRTPAAIRAALFASVEDRVCRGARVRARGDQRRGALAGALGGADPGASVNCSRWQPRFRFRRPAAGSGPWRRSARAGGGVRPLCMLARRAIGARPPVAATNDPGDEDAGSSGTPDHELSWSVDPIANAWRRRAGLGAARAALRRCADREGAITAPLDQHDEAGSRCRARYAAGGRRGAERVRSSPASGPVARTRPWRQRSRRAEIGTGRRSGGAGAAHRRTAARAPR